MDSQPHHQGGPPPASPDEPSTLACVPAGSRPPAAPRLEDDCWILSGPTAAGKTALGIGLARRLGAEIVSVDSMAIYTGLDVGTAKPTAEERAAVPHHCIDIVPPAAPFSVARWLAEAAVAVEEIRRRGRRILFVGGTPLFLRALRDGLAPLPGDAPEVRRQLAEEAARSGLAALHARLAAVDPEAAARIHPHDAKRIVRALEVIHTTGRPLTESWREARRANGCPPAAAAFTSQMLVVDLPRHVLYGRIDRRVEQMFACGLIEETRAALDAGGIGATARQAAGYAEAIAVLEGSLTLDHAIAQTKTRTRQLAKRQLTWLRSFEHAVWVTG